MQNIGGIGIKIGQNFKNRVKIESMNFNQDYNQNNYYLSQQSYTWVQKMINNAEMLEILFKNQFMQNENNLLDCILNMMNQAHGVVTRRVAILS